MKIVKISEKIGYLRKTPKEKQTMIVLGEAYSLWNTLEKRYDILMSTQVLNEFTKDYDLKKIVGDGIEVIKSQITTLEKLMREFRIPMPNRPPQEANIVIDINTITDRFIFREIYRGMSEFMFQHISSLQRSHSSYIRETFRKFLIQELDMYDGFYEYGKLKGYLHEAPSFRI